jgi:hypothetical protein
MRFWAAALILFSALWPAAARTFVVSSTNDTTSVASLRGAIIEANRIGGANTIILTKKTYFLTIPGIDEDRARTGDLDVTNGRLSIRGAGGNVTIDASTLGDRIFQVSRLASLTVEGVTLQRGTAFGGDYASWAHEDGEAGGAIYNAGAVSLRHCRIMRNSSGAGGVMMGNAPGGVGGPGGAIYNTGSLTMQACAITANAAGPSQVSSQGGDGGGIYNSGLCVLSDCSIVGNSSGSGGGADIGIGFGGNGGQGGGVYNAGTMLLTRCTISGNLTGSGTDGGLPGWSNTQTGGGPGGNGGSGAGLYNSGRLEMYLCTVSGNTNGQGGNGGNGWVGGNGGQGGFGAGLLNAGSLLVDSCTISANAAGRGGNAGTNWNWEGIERNPGAPGGGGGGIFSGTGASARLRNSIVALNRVGEGGLGSTNGPEGSGEDLSGSVTSQGWNLIGDADGSSGFTNGMRGDLVGGAAAPIDPLLGPLRDNGGLTFTHALLPGSPAVDQGKRSSFHTDQRGHPRPHDFRSVPNAAGGDGTDIGAFELDLPALSVSRHARGTVVSWDSSFPGYRVEATTNINLTGWTEVSGTAGLLNGEYHSTNNTGADFKFFRLRRIWGGPIR